MSRFRAVIAISCVVVVACLDLDHLQSGAESDAGSDAGVATDGVSASDAGSVIDASTTDTSSVKDVDPIDVGVDAGTDAGSPWSAYVYTEGTGLWTGPFSLPAFWGDAGTANAPPDRGISAAVKFSSFDRLLIFAEDGTLYRRANGAWTPPAPATQVFPGLTKAPQCAEHIPQSDGGTEKVDIILVDNPVALLYHYTNIDVIGSDGTRNMTDGPPGPPQASEPVLWDFELFDVSKFQISADWALFYFGYGNKVWRMDGAGAWLSWDFATFPYFAGKSNLPPTDRIKAAWYEAGTKQVVMLVQN